MRRLNLVGISVFAITVVFARGEMANAYDSQIDEGRAMVAGVSNLPSTNTGDTTGLIGLGSALMALGVFLVRRPAKTRE